MPGFLGAVLTVGRIVYPRQSSAEQTREGEGQMALVIGEQFAQISHRITYLSGGLESAHIRKAVCDILEGGERALQERARRLRVRLER